MPFAFRWTRRSSRQRGLARDEVRDSLTRINLPAGALYGTNRQFTVQANSQLSSAAQFRPMIIAYRNNNLVSWSTSPTYSTASRMINRPSGWMACPP